MIRESQGASHQPLGNLQEVGVVIGGMRRQAKLSQTALGQAAGLSRMPVYRLEAGQDISLRSFLAMLQALKLQLALRPTPTEALLPSDLKAAFAHLHSDEHEE